MAFAGHYPRYPIDLNMLRGDRIMTRLDFVDAAVPIPKVGDFVLAEEEERDVYLAVVEEVNGGRVSLRLLLNSWTPAVKINGAYVPAA